MAESRAAVHDSRAPAAASAVAAANTPAAAGPTQDGLHRGLGNSFLSQVAVSAADDPAETAAETRARQVLAAAPGPVVGGGRAPWLPADVTTAEGMPLGAADRAFFEPRLGIDLGHVRVHDDSRAAALATAAGTNAVTVGSHVFLAPGAGRAVLAHELAHVEQDHHEPAIFRAPPPQAAGGKRLIPTGTSTSAAARSLAEVITQILGPAPRLFVGLGSHYLSFYDGGGALLGQIAVKDSAKISFVAGAYVFKGQFLVAIVHRGNGYGLEATGPQGGSVIFTRDPVKPAPATAAVAGDGQPPTAAGQKPAAPKTAALDVEALVTEPDRIRSLAAQVPGLMGTVFFVPQIDSAGDTKIGGTGTGAPALYASPIEGRGDGQPPNAPPWPVSMEGPKLVPIDADPTFSAKVDWAANGNYSLAAQVISQVGETIHYRWERYDITRYAHQQLAAAKTPPKAGEKTLDQRIEEFSRSKVGTGTDVTGSGGARREFTREFEDWWKDNRRAAAGVRDPHGDTVGERLSNLEANRLSLELAPVSLLVTTLGATLRLLADLFAGPRQQQEIPLEQQGVFLIRVITTPAIGSNTKGDPVVRPPSVATKLVEVAPMETTVRESLDEPSAQMAELQAQIDLAVNEGEKGKAKAEYLKHLLEEAKRRFLGSPLVVLQDRAAAKRKELEDFAKAHAGRTDYKGERELEQLEDQVKLANLHESKRLEGAAAGSLPPAVRLNATLISEVTGEAYPLLLSAGPMALAGTRHRWLISDVTNRDGYEFVGEGDTPSAAFVSALTKFGAKAAYGRGRIGVRTAGLGLEANALPEYMVDSQPADWALAEKRIDDLVATLAALGLFVASAGTAGAVIGAAVAAARLIDRWRHGTLRLDAQTVGDVLGILGGVGAVGQLAAGLRVQKFEKFFAIMSEGGASEAQLSSAAAALRGAQTLARVVELANEAVNYGGLIWGSLQFFEKMVEINDQERSGKITHAAARRGRAEAISSAVQNTGLFLAANVAKAKGSAEKAAEQGKPAEPKPADPKSVEAKPGEPGPPEAGRPAEQAKPAEEGKPAVADKTTAGAAPIGERPATLAEMREAMPPDVRSMVSIDPTLHGDTVKVEYTLDQKTGLVTEIRVRCGPDARPGTVALHTGTVRTMQKYQGFAGRVRQALGWVGKIVGLEVATPENRAQFEAKLEVEKLPKLIEAQLERMRKLDDPNARDLAEAELATLEVQLAEHLQTLELGGIGDGEGYVAAKGLSKPKQREYADLLTKLRQHEPGSDQHKKIRREMYELVGGKLEFPAWESIYDANMERANKANAIVKAEHQRLGWGKPEQTVPVGGGEVRRLDIADVGRRRGVEIKAYETERIYASEDILSEVRRDAWLVKRGWSIKWVLIDTQASGPLLKALSDAGILVEHRTSTRGGTEFDSRILPARR